MSIRAAIFALLGLVHGAAAADTGFMLPQKFELRDETISVIASFSDTFPLASHPLRSDHFAVTGPNGTVMDFAAEDALSDMTVLAFKPSGPGTYRLSSGKRLGRKGEAAMIGGRIVRLGEDGVDPAGLPTGTERLTSQTATVSEAYVTSGAATEISASFPTGRLSLTPINHPGGLKGGMTFRALVHFDDRPVRPDEAFLVAGLGHYSGKGDGDRLEVGTNGIIATGPLQPGLYVVLIRHLARAPDGAETDVRSYSTTLTFEVRNAECLLSPKPADCA